MSDVDGIKNDSTMNEQSGHASPRGKMLFRTGRTILTSWHWIKED